MTEIIQGTDEWFEARRGKVTGSRTADVMMTKDKAGYRNYLAQLTAERLTGKVEETFCSYDMQRGTELEPIARSIYEFMKGVTVIEVGFVDHPYIGMMGCSPDGLVSSDGMVEIKCPKSAQHQELLLGGKIDGKYIKQVQEQMCCTGRKWTDYCSYDPTMPVALQLKVIRVERDEKVITEIEKSAMMFLEQVDIRVAELEKLL